MAAPTNRLLALSAPPEMEMPAHLDPAYDGYALSPADLMYQRGEAPSLRQEPGSGRLPTMGERWKQFLAKTKPTMNNVK